MLQQTQVDRVIPYYERFLKKYPTVQTLSKSKLSDVLKLWSGLGYNRRAKLLRDTAIAVMSEYNGVFPHSREELVDLPGIGPYTAGAIRAFAFNEPEVFIETNIRTVFMHHMDLFHLSYDRETDGIVDDADILPLVRLAAEGQDQRSWYSALMDYGAFLKRSGVRINSRSKHYVKQSKFDGSLRQARGIILKVLHDASKNALTERQIIRRCHLEHERLIDALAGLEKDGLVHKMKGKWRIS